MLLERIRQFAMKLEASEGTAETLAGADVKVEVEELASTFTRNRLARNPLRQTFSKKRSIPGKGTGTISGKVELVGGGAAGTKPPVADLLGAMGFDEYVTKKLTTTGAITGTFIPGEKIVDSSGGTVDARFIKHESNTLFYLLISGDDFAGADTITGSTSGATVDAHGTPAITALNYGYIPNSLAPKSYTAADYYNGKRKIVFGARATGSIGIEGAAELAYLNFNLEGPATKPIDAALLSGAAPANIPPEPFMNAGVCVHNSTPVDIDSMNVDFGLTTAIRPSANAAEGQKSTRITDRLPKITIDPEEQLEATVPFWTNHDIGTLFGFCAYIGSTASKRCAILMPRADYEGMQPAERDGIKTLQATLMSTESDAGDRELIVAFF